MNNDNQNETGGNNLNGTEPFLLVIDRNRERNELRGYDRFILGPVTDADGYSAEENVQYMEGMIQKTDRAFETTIVRASEVQANHAALNRFGVMTHDEVTAAFKILTPNKAALIDLLVSLGAL